MSDLNLELVKFRTIGKPYSSWRAILAELGCSDTDFLIFLRKTHDLFIDKKQDEMLFLVQDTQQMRLLLEDGVPSPTMLQIAMTSRAWAKSAAEAEEKWMAAMKDTTVNGDN